MQAHLSSAACLSEAIQDIRARQSTGYMNATGSPGCGIMPSQPRPPGRWLPEQCSLPPGSQSPQWSQPRASGTGTSTQICRFTLHGRAGTGLPSGPVGSVRCKQTASALAVLWFFFLFTLCVLVIPTVNQMPLQSHLLPGIRSGSL